MGQQLKLMWSKIFNCINKKLSLLVLVISCIGSFLFFSVKDNLPLALHKASSVALFDRYQQLLRIQLTGDEKYRLQTHLKDIDSNFIKSLLSKEDQYFYYHLGVNPISLANGFYRTYILKDRRVGASTITMQVVRLMEPDSTNHLWGKIKQIFKAIFLELQYSKVQILEAYLSWAPYGSNIEGVQAACLGYFKKTCSKLTNEEIKLLIQIPQNPQKFLQLAHAAKKNYPYFAPHFTEWVLNEVNNKPLNKSLIHTTLNLKLQNKFELLASEYLQQIKSTGVNNLSVLYIDNLTGEVLVYIGSANFFDVKIKGQIDGNQSLKAPGSTLKPFIYGLAFDQGLIHPQSLVKDIPMNFAGLAPENFDSEYMGLLPAEQALILSRNVPVVELAQFLKKPSFYDFMKNKISQKLKPESYYGFSLELGGVEMTSLDLAQMYLNLAQLSSAKKITWNKNIKNEFVDQKNLPQDRLSLSAEASYLVAQILKKNPRQENSPLSEIVQESLPYFWKTGTSKSYKDAWAVGTIGNKTLVVWLGDHDKISNPALVGRQIAGPLFFKFYDYLKNSQPNFQDKNPVWNSRVGLNLKNVDICSVSKKMLTSACGHHHETVAVIPATSPIANCDVHRTIYENKHGQIFCEPQEETQAKNIEVWPSYVVEFYKRAGLKYTPGKNILAYQQLNCQRQIFSASTIVSPQPFIKYIIRKGQSAMTQIKIPLKAQVSASTKYIDWFVNQNYIGRKFFNKSEEDLFFETARPGNYNVSFVDNLGTTENTTFEVQVESVNSTRAE